MVEVELRLPTDADLDLTNELINELNENSEFHARNEIIPSDSDQLSKGGSLSLIVGLASGQLLVPLIDLLKGYLLRQKAVTTITLKIGGDELHISGTDVSEDQDKLVKLFSKYAGTQ